VKRLFRLLFLSERGRSNKRYLNIGEEIKDEIVNGGNNLVYKVRSRVRY